MCVKVQIYCEEIDGKKSQRQSWTSWCIHIQHKTLRLWQLSTKRYKICIQIYKFGRRKNGIITRICLNFWRSQIFKKTFSNAQKKLDVDFGQFCFFPQSGCLWSTVANETTPPACLVSLELCTLWKYESLPQYGTSRPCEPLPSVMV